MPAEATFEEVLASCRAYIQTLEEFCNGQQEFVGVEANVANLYSVLLRVSEQQPTEDADPECSISHDDWQDMVKRARAKLPHDLYHSLFEGQFEIDQEPDFGTGSLADDLTDIWRDLTKALLMLTAGASQASVLWELWFNFKHHWGRHAVDALWAFHRLRQL
jgi:hypothetical protein